MSEKREEIRKKIHELSVEIARLSCDILEDEDVPLGIVQVVVVNVLGVAQIHLGVQIATKEDLRGVGIPIDELAEALADAKPEEKPAAEQVEDLLKSLKRPSNPGGASGTN